MKTGYASIKIFGRYSFYIIWAVLLLDINMALSTEASGQMTAQELYQGYANWLHYMHTSLSFRETEETTFKGFDWSFDKQLTRKMVCRDGKQSAGFKDSYFFLKDESLHDGSRVRTLYTEEQKMTYSGRLQKPRAMTIDPRPHKREFPERIRSNSGNSIILDGYIVGDNRLWIMDIVEQSEKMVLREQPEIIDGYETFVLEIDGDYGKHMIWIDPACGYCSRQLVVVKEPGDLWDNVIVGEDVLPMRNYPQSVLQRKELRVSSVKFQNIDGIYIPVSGTVIESYEFADGKEANKKSVFQREDVTTSPDFEAFRTEFFENTIDGTPLFFMDDVRRGIKYEWHQGEPRAAASSEELDAIDEIIEETVDMSDDSDMQHEISKDKEDNAENTISSDDSNEPQQSQLDYRHTGRRWWLYGICVILFFGIIAGLYLKICVR